MLLSSLYISVFALLGPLLTPAAPTSPSYAEIPSLPLAKTYVPDVDIQRYFVSEKLDGVRAYWNGEQLITRNGTILRAPKNFTAGFPPYPLDGELWLGRNRFEELSGIVRRHQPHPNAWDDINYVVWDLPQLTDIFSERYQVLKRLSHTWQAPHLQAIAQRRHVNEEQLFEHLNEVIQQGGEGLMLQEANADYHIGRTDTLLKLKTYEDAEAKVLEHRPGKGKFKGMMGALTVQDMQGKIFAVGTGFTTEQRLSPPPVGSTITYRYRGRTSSGQPRFASYLRIRPLD